MLQRKICCHSVRLISVIRSTDYNICQKRCERRGND